MSLAKEVIEEVKKYPAEYKFNLVSQLMRCAISIPSNISEGSARTTNKEFSRFLDIAQGSACELETQLILSKNLNLLDDKRFYHFQSKVNELQKMIRGFKGSLVV